MRGFRSIVVRMISSRRPCVPANDWSLWSSRTLRTLALQQRCGSGRTPPGPAPRPSRALSFLLEGDFLGVPGGCVIPRRDRRPLVRLGDLLRRVSFLYASVSCSVGLCKVAANAAEQGVIVIPISTTAAARPATRGFRRHHRQARSGDADRPGPDRLAVEEAAEVVGQRAAVGVASARGPSAGTSGRSSPGRAATFGWSRRGGTGSWLRTWSSVSSGRRALERRPAGEHLVEDGPERVDVGRRADLAGPAPRPARGPCSWACP